MSVRHYRYVQCDVFTDRPLTGNPLAVFPDARGLTSEEMQAIARETNLSETTFVLPPTDRRAAARIRIFTVSVELPFAGHPVIGTWFTLAHEGEIDASKIETLPAAPGEERIGLYQELGIGVLPVEIAYQNRVPLSVTMTQGSPAFFERIEDIDALARALGIDPEEIRSTGLPVQIVSTGLRQLMIPVGSLSTLGGARPDAERLVQFGARARTESFYLFTEETVDGRADVHTRMFAAFERVFEDPATGSAAGALGAYLVHHGVCGAGAQVASVRVEQGHELNRPSAIDIEVERDGSDVVAVRVSGRAVIVMRGELTL